MFNARSWMLFANHGNKTKPGVIPPMALTAASISRSSNQLITNGTLTAISFDVKDFDTGGYYSAASPTLLTVPANGLYLACLGLLFGGPLAAVGIREAGFIKNASTAVVYGTFSQSGSATSNANAIGGSYIFSLNAGDTISAWALQSSGASLNIAGDATQKQVFMGIMSLQ